MLAVDTNILVRFFTHDQPDATARAIRILQSPRVWVTKTVLLETEWVLRAVYELPSDRVARALRALAGLDNVEVEDPLQVSQALDAYDLGLDFADALHLAGAEGRQFVSFDDKFVKRARRAGFANVRLP